MGRRDPGPPAGHVQHHQVRRRALARAARRVGPESDHQLHLGLRAARRTGPAELRGREDGHRGTDLFRRQLTGQVRGDGERGLTGRGHPDDRLRAGRPAPGPAGDAGRALAGQRGTARRLPGQRAIRLDHRADRARRRVRSCVVQQPGAGDPADRHRAVVAGRAGGAGRAVVRAGAGRAGAGRARAMMAKPVPVPTPETQPFWDGSAEGELRIQRCADCATAFFYPRPVCPACGSVNVEWFTASGQATLYSYVINHRPAPGFEDDGPYAIAVVQLAEGPRMMTSLTGVPNTPEDLVLDMPLRVTFERRGDVYLPVFTPEAAP